MNCELNPDTPTHSNLQTFLVIPEHAAPGGAQGPRMAMPSKTQMDALLRKVEARRKKR